MSLTKNDFAETQTANASGLATGTNVITRASATLSNNACGSFSEAVPVSTPSDTVPADGCYRYTLTGVDIVGNQATATSTIAKVDTVKPSTTDNSATIGNAWKNTTQTVTLTPTDASSGVANTYYTTDGFHADDRIVARHLGRSQRDRRLHDQVLLGRQRGQPGDSPDGRYTDSDRQDTADELARPPVVPRSGGCLPERQHALLQEQRRRVVKACHHCHRRPLGAGIGHVPACLGYELDARHGDRERAERRPVRVLDLLVDERSWHALWLTGDLHLGRRRRQHERQHRPDVHARHDRADGRLGYGAGVHEQHHCPVTFSAGTDAASGVNVASGQLSRAQGTYTPSAATQCSAFGSFSNVGPAGPSSPFSDTVPAANACYQYRYTVSDNVGNSVTYTSLSVAVDTTAPTATNVTLSNGGSTIGVAEKGDTVVITYGEVMDASSFCSNWVNDGSPQTKSGTGGGVSVTITDSGTSDVLSSVTASGCTFHLGSVALNANYVTSTAVFSGNGSNASAVSWNPASRQLTITFGALSAGTVNGLTQAASTPSYTADTTLKDQAGNAIGQARSRAPARASESVQ